MERSSWSSFQSCLCGPGPLTSLSLLWLCFLRERSGQREQLSALGLQFLLKLLKPQSSASAPPSALHPPLQPRLPNFCPLQSPYPYTSCFWVWDAVLLSTNSSLPFKALLWQACPHPALSAHLHVPSQVLPYPMVPTRPWNL